MNNSVSNVDLPLRTDRDIFGFSTDLILTNNSGYTGAFWRVKMRNGNTLYNVAHNTGYMGTSNISGSSSTGTAVLTQFDGLSQHNLGTGASMNLKMTFFRNNDSSYRTCGQFHCKASDWSQTSTFGFFSLRTNTNMDGIRFERGYSVGNWNYVGKYALTKVRD